MGDWRFRKELDKALFFALCAENRRMAHILLKDYEADPGRKHSSCGLHGAARRGFHDEIQLYIQEHDACPDTKDETSLTPVMYAMMLEAPRDWETICLLFNLGADPMILIEGWTYAQWAIEMRKPDLAPRLDEAARRACRDKTFLPLAVHVTVALAVRLAVPVAVAVVAVVLVASAVVLVALVLVAVVFVAPAPAVTSLPHAVSASAAFVAAALILRLACRIHRH
ncbi:hypothetical protein H9Q69_005660 [Fusarium xylarioides]|nr:hypothetical protein H9Q69_005660 [Fusarium xylarioides]